MLTPNIGIWHYPRFQPEPERVQRAMVWWSVIRFGPEKLLIGAEILLPKTAV